MNCSAGHILAMTPEQLQAYRWEREIDERNRPLTDDELETMFPPGYRVLPPPAGYVRSLIPLTLLEQLSYVILRSFSQSNKIRPLTL